MAAVGQPLLGAGEADRRWLPQQHDCYLIVISLAFAIIGILGAGMQCSSMPLSDMVAVENFDFRRFGDNLWLRNATNFVPGPSSMQVASRKNEQTVDACLKIASAREIRGVSAVWYNFSDGTCNMYGDVPRATTSDASHEGLHQLWIAQTFYAEDPSCTTTTGGSCFLGTCQTSRGPTTCEAMFCHCSQFTCATASGECTYEFPLRQNRFRLLCREWFGQYIAATLKTGLLAFMMASIQEFIQPKNIVLKTMLHHNWIWHLADPCLTLCVIWSYWPTMSCHQRWLAIFVGVQAALQLVLFIVHRLSRRSIACFESKRNDVLFWACPTISLTECFQSALSEWPQAKCWLLDIVKVCSWSACMPCMASLWYGLHGEVLGHPYYGQTSIALIGVDLYYIVNAVALFCVLAKQRILEIEESEERFYSAPNSPTKL